MGTGILERILGEHPFPRDMKEDHLRAIAGSATVVRFEAGDEIFREGDPAHRFYLIRTGTVALQQVSYRIEPFTVLSLNQGTSLGWSWLFPPYRWKFSARTIHPPRAFAMDSRCLRDKAENDHDLGYELLKRFSRVFETRLETMRLQLADVSRDR